MKTQTCLTVTDKYKLYANIKDNGQMPRSKEGHSHFIQSFKNPDNHRPSDDRVESDLGHDCPDEADFDLRRWQQLFDETGIKPALIRSFRNHKDSGDQVNIILHDYSRGPASQAFGWLKLAVNETDFHLDLVKDPVGYRYLQTNPAEQALLWLVAGFGLTEKPDDINYREIRLIIESIRAGQIRLAHKYLDEYINQD